MDPALFVICALSFCVVVLFLLLFRVHYQHPHSRPSVFDWFWNRPTAIPADRSAFDSLHLYRNKTYTTRVPDAYTHQEQASFLYAPRREEKTLVREDLPPFPRASTDMFGRRTPSDMSSVSDPLQEDDWRVYNDQVQQANSRLLDPRSYIRLARQGDLEPPSPAYPSKPHGFAPDGSII